MKPEDIEQKARDIVDSPRQLSAFIRDPDKYVQQSMPGSLKNLFHDKSELQESRQELRKTVRRSINERSDLQMLEALELEKATFFKDAMENHQRTFNTILWMSKTTFVIGIGLILGAAVAVVFGQDTLQKALVGGLAGGGGLLSTFFAVFMMTNDSIRRANGDNAQIRAILHSFATQSLTLRRAAVDGIEDSQRIADKLQALTERTVELIERRVEPVPRDGQPPG